jgi:hypothetical protein
LQPLEPYPGSMPPWRCRCLTCGREVSPNHNSVSKRGSGCKYCAGMVVEDEDAVGVMKAAGLQPLEPYPGAGNQWLCLCQGCGNETKPTYSNIRGGHSGCRSCASSSFDPLAPALVYIVVHDELEAVKVGVTGLGAINDRVAQHERHGWRRLGTWNVDTGRRAEKIEADVLRWWRSELQAPQALLAESVPQGGATETAPLSRVPLAETANRIWRLAAEA